MDPMLSGVAAVLGYVLFMFTTMLHEMGHALAARLLGCRDAYAPGRISWNPFEHMARSRFGLAIMPLIAMIANMRIAGAWTFGYPAAPFDPAWAVNNKRKAAWIAFGGPAANVAIGLAVALAIRIGVSNHWFTYDFSGTPWLLVKGATPALDGLAVLLSMLFYQNILMAAFNLMPLPPLDGFTLAAFWMKPESALSFYQWESKLSFLYPLAVFHATALFWSVMSRVYVYSLAALF